MPEHTHNEPIEAKEVADDLASVIEAGQDYLSDLFLSDVKTAEADGVVTLTFAASRKADSVKTLFRMTIQATGVK